MALRSAPAADDRSGPRYETRKATASLLSRGRKARESRLDAADMVDIEGAAKAAGTSEAGVLSWIDADRCIALKRTTAAWRLPVWQFEPRIFSALPELSQAMETTDAWALLEFLETPNGALGGLTPRQALERGMHDRVVTLAGAH